MKAENVAGTDSLSGNFIPHKTDSDELAAKLDDNVLLLRTLHL